MNSRSVFLFLLFFLLNYSGEDEVPLPNESDIFLNEGLNYGKDSFKEMKSIGPISEIRFIKELKQQIVLMKPAPQFN